MCGIGAVILREGNAIEFAKKILVGQEFKGTSSSGIAYLEDGEIKVFKEVKSPSQFVKDLDGIKSRVVIVHNRAPSVGRVSIENAHPFLSCDGKFALVHNGTYYGYKLLKLLLNDKHNIQGETDAEIICHFIEEYGKMKGYSTLVKSSSGQKLILLFKDKVIGLGEFWVVKDENGIYIVQEISVFEDMFENQRKYVYRVDGYFEVNLNNFKLSGDVSFVGRKRFRKSEYNELDNHTPKPWNEEEWKNRYEYGDIDKWREEWW